MEHMDTFDPEHVAMRPLMRPSRRTKHCSIMGEKRGCVTVLLGNFFSAIENRSLAQLQECMRKEPNRINGHGGPFYITPLHFATELAWLDGIKELLEQGASVCVRNQYDQTPLHYAALGKQEPIMALLLTCHSKARAINLHDMRGMSPLHVAAANGCLSVVKLLLENGALVTTQDNQGESPLHKAAKVGAFDVMVTLMEAGADLRAKDLRGISAMRWLILSTSNGLQNLLDHLLITSDVGSRRSPITFNFLPLATKSGKRQCQLLSYFIETDNGEILAHPICHVFILIKWKTAKLIFLGCLLYFMVYALLTSLFIFMRRLEKEFDTEHSPNVTHTVDDAHIMLNSDSYTGMMQGMYVILCIMTLLLIMTQLNRLRVQGWTCIKAANFWFQLLSNVCVSSLLAMYWYDRPTVVANLEVNIGTVELLFLHLQFLFILRKYPTYGLYVAMFIRVAKEFLKLFLVYCTLLVSFTAIMFLVFNNDDQEDPVNSRWQLLFLKTVTMMIGSVEVNDSLAKQLDALPITGYILFFFSVVFISIVLANLLVALAVSDIRELRASAHLTRLASMVEAILNMEQLCDFPLLRCLAYHCRLDTMAAHVRLWPLQDSRQPSVTVEVRQQYQKTPRGSRFFEWLLERFHPSRYQVNIPDALREDVLARVTARETAPIDPDQLDIPYDYKVYFDEILRRLKLLEVSQTH